MNNLVHGFIELFFVTRLDPFFMERTMKILSACFCGILGFGSLANAAVPNERPLTLAQAPKAPEAKEHEEHGPHGGELVELGKEDYHLEVVHDDKTGTIVMYLLDSTAKKSVPISSKEIVVNVKADGRGKQYKIPATPQQGDPQDTASVFSVKSKELIESIEKKGSDATVVIDIAGKQFRGKLHNDHDHEHEKK